MGNAILTSRGGSGGSGNSAEAIGDIRYSCKTDLGDNYLLCNGEAIWKDQYPELFEVLDNENSYTSMVIENDGLYVIQTTRCKYIADLDLYVVVAAEYLASNSTNRQIAVYYADSESVKSNLWNKNVVFTKSSTYNFYSVDFEYAFGKFFISYTIQNIAGVFVLSSNTINNTSWTSTTLANSNTKLLAQLFYRNNTLIAISYLNNAAPWVQYTTNGSTWTDIKVLGSNIIPGAITNVVYFNNYWIIAGINASMYGTSLDSAGSFQSSNCGGVRDFIVFKDVILYSQYYSTTGSLGYCTDGARMCYTCKYADNGAYINITNQTSFRISQYDSEYAYIFTSQGVYRSSDGITWEFVSSTSSHNVYGKDVYYDDNGWNGITAGSGNIVNGLDMSPGVVIDCSDIRTLPTITSEDTEYAYIKAKE